MADSFLASMVVKGGYMMTNETTEPPLICDEAFDFKPIATYQPKNNVMLARLSQLAYASESTITATIQQWQRVDPSLQFQLRDFPEYSLKYRYLILSSQTYTILVFRGTDNLMNWVTDIEVKHVPFEGNEAQFGRVHDGFYHSVLSMASSIRQDMQQLRQQQPLYVTGHSLGAAQALLSVLMIDELKDFTQIINYGQPRVGNKAFQRWVDLVIAGRYFRQVNEGDPVPEVPSVDYVHVGEFYMLCKDEQYQKIVGVEQPISILKELKDLSDDDIHDHAIAKYLQNSLHNLDWPFTPHKTEKT
ncbi:lipase family protein [Algicola sagamiensis]|uniref:lipase family protein n=1 Tax=Algicola sagamiensis TaxID=163869 RepID=UPI0003670B2B|nr:lipase family protein [Algicola sagamiensis]